MNYIKLTGLLPLAGLLAFGAAHAQGDASQQPPSGRDQQFLTYAAEDNQAEIQLCLIAEKRAVDPALNAFARLMVDDHVQVESRLAALGAELHAKLSDAIGKDGQETMSKLTPLSGREFEQTFIEAQIKDHSNDIDKYSKEARETQNQRIRQYASETIPLLKQHLALARAVKTQLGGQTVGKSGKP
ncbi:MAG: DUF4142 domain-containing protein [Bradyrhizobium sp.]|nr:DUF4142 domain-containing protein [Bradyrhizobium sp.]